LPEIKADQEKTTWVVTNLISNAIRYSYENSTIYIAAEAKENTLLITVKDNGIGISPQYKNKIFSINISVFRDQKKKEPGLGLPSVKNLSKHKAARFRLKAISDLEANL